MSVISSGIQWIYNYFSGQTLSARSGSRNLKRPSQSRPRNIEKKGRKKVCPRGREGGAVDIENGYVLNFRGWSDSDGERIRNWKKVTRGGKLRLRWKRRRGM